jgi:hypothetical protein
LEHLGLESTGEIPCRLAAGGGVEGENQTPPRAGRNTRRSTKFFHERIDRSALIGSCTTCSLKTRSGMDFPSRELDGPAPARAAGAARLRCPWATRARRPATSR